jgi:hypothetical protein
VDATQLATLIAFDRSTIGDVLTRLEAKGWAVRHSSGSDKRVKLLRLSSEGAKVLRRVEPAVQGVQKRLLAPRAPGDRLTLVRLLARTPIMISCRFPYRHVRPARRGVTLSSGLVSFQGFAMAFEGTFGKQNNRWGRGLVSACLGVLHPIRKRARRATRKIESSPRTRVAVPSQRLLVASLSTTYLRPSGMLSSIVALDVGRRPALANEDPTTRQKCPGRNFHGAA